MTTLLARIPQKIARALKPSFAEVDRYARIILRHERRPKSALAACRKEAELQLWTTRALAFKEPISTVASVASGAKSRRAESSTGQEMRADPDLRELALA